MMGRKTVFIFIISAIGLAGIALMWQPWPERFHYWLLPKLGEGAFIASILALSVDQFSKHRLLTEVAQDVWTYIVGHPLPKEVQEYVKALANTHLLRRDWEIKYVFSKADDPSKIKIRVEAKFFLQNLSSTNQKYTQILALEKHDRHAIKMLACDSTESKACYLLNSTNTPKLQKNDEDDPGVIRAEGKKIDIRPNLDSPNIRYQLTAVHELEPPIEYSDIYSFGEPSLYVTVTAEHPSDIDVLISPEKPAFANTVASRKDRWEFRRLFVRGDHIRIRWRPKPPAH